jgi:hypothetical protein
MSKPPRTHYLGSNALRKFPVFLKLLVQFTFGGKLQDEEHSGFIMKIAIQAQYIWMSKSLKKSAHE